MAAGVEDSLPAEISDLIDRFDIECNELDFGDDDNKHEDCLFVRLTDKGTVNKFQIYEKTFTVADCVAILKRAKYEHLPISKFLSLIQHCLSEENESHDVQFTTNKSKENTTRLQIDIIYAPDE